MKLSADAIGQFLFLTQSSLLEGVLKDTAFKFLDNINTPQRETLVDDDIMARI